MLVRLFIALLLTGGSLPAQACAVCGAGQKDPAAIAFFISTVVLSLVPVLMICGTLYFIYRSVKRARAETKEIQP